MESVVGDGCVDALSNVGRAGWGPPNQWCWSFYANLEAHLPARREMESTHLLKRSVARKPTKHVTFGESTSVEKVVKKVEKKPEKDKGERWEPPEGTWDPDLPFGGKVVVARRKIQEPLWWRLIEVTIIIAVIVFCIFSYFHIDAVVFRVDQIYAHFGHTEAQHKVGQRYLQGHGVKQDHEKAMHWFGRAAESGHPEASYNLAVGHMKGHIELEKGHAKKLVHHAANHGLKEAHHVLREFCDKGKCE